MKPKAKFNAAKYDRAKRLMFAAVEALLENWNFDLYFINQRDLRPCHILRNGAITGSAVAEFAEALEREFRGAA